MSDTNGKKLSSAEYHKTETAWNGYSYQDGDLHENVKTETYNGLQEKTSEHIETNFSELTAGSCGWAPSNVDTPTIRAKVKLI